MPSLSAYVQLCNNFVKCESDKAIGNEETREGRKQFRKASFYFTSEYL